jgi:hypothetical protein
MVNFILKTHLMVVEYGLNTGTDILITENDNYYLYYIVANNYNNALIINTK